jgi:protein CpxP
LGRLFYAILHEDDVENALRDFLVPAGKQAAWHPAHAVSASQREAMVRALGADASGGRQISATRLLHSRQPVSTSRSSASALRKVRCAIFRPARARARCDTDAFLSYVWKRTEIPSRQGNNNWPTGSKSIGAPELEVTRRQVMKRSNHQFTHAAARAIATGVLAATIAFASGPIIAAQASGKDRIEARIHDMHARLKITAAQEDQWKQVAQVMRDNENTIDPLIKDRAKNAKTMTAMDDLKSYAEITDAHAEALKNFTPVFGTLYASLSDAQKKEADAFFRNGVRKTSKTK